MKIKFLKEDYEDDSFTYKGVNVVRTEDGWVDDEGNRYMSYLTPGDIKIYIDSDLRNRYESINEAAEYKDDIEEIDKNFYKSGGAWRYRGYGMPDEYRPLIKNVIIEDGVTEIEDDSFWGCESLKSITIPTSVTRIGERAFGECESLKSITIPSSVKVIEYGAFYECDSLKDVYYQGSEEDWSRIKIYLENSELLSANIHFNSKITNESYKFRFKRVYNE